MSNGQTSVQMNNPQEAYTEFLADHLARVKLSVLSKQICHVLLRTKWNHLSIEQKAIWLAKSRNQEIIHYTPFQMCLREQTSSKQQELEQQQQEQEQEPDFVLCKTDGELGSTRDSSKRVLSESG